MHGRITNFTPALFVFLLLAAGCSDNGGVATGGSGLAGPGSVFSTRVTAEPLTIRPEFLSSPFCRTQFPFSLRLILVVSAGQERFLRVIRFNLLDSFGGRTFPTAISSPAAPTSVPVSIPSSLPIPIPGTLPFHGVPVSGSQRLPFSLQFGCGVRPAGTLSVSVETADRRGVADVSQITVRVGE
jgi:hypothetical protein